MSKKKDSSIQPMLIDLERRCAGNTQLEKLAKNVADEFNKIYQVDSNVKGSERRRINKILHAMRGLETGLYTYLSIHHIGPTQIADKNMGSYMKTLKNPPIIGGKKCFSSLSGKVFAVGFSSTGSIRYKRNLYLHNANSYPTEAETNKVIEEVYQFFNCVLNLG